MPVVTLRAARPDELDELSALALRSKAYWGYDEAFLEACRPELTITAERLERELCRVAEVGPAASLATSADVAVPGTEVSCRAGGVAGRDRANRCRIAPLAGFYSLALGSDADDGAHGQPAPGAAGGGGASRAGELMDLFVAPELIGTGVGLALWRDLLHQCGAHEIARVRIEADPNAEAWYLSRGAVRVGTAPSGSVPGRRLPLLELAIGGEPPGHAEA